MPVHVDLMCLHVCFSFFLTDSFNKAYFSVGLYCRECYRNLALPQGPSLRQKQMKASQGCEQLARVQVGVCGCGAGCVAVETGGGG